VTDPFIFRSFFFQRFFFEENEFVCKRSSFTIKSVVAHQLTCIKRLKSAKIPFSGNGDSSSDITTVDTYCPINGHFSFTYTPQISPLIDNLSVKKIKIKNHFLGNGDSSTDMTTVDTYCPINGHFSFTYTRQMSSLIDNSADEFCSRKSSLLTNCPGKKSYLNCPFNERKHFNGSKNFC
jgi:hypothetical protein